jgi:hypothetical protein
VMSGTLAAACTPRRGVMRTSNVSSGTRIVVSSARGLSLFEEPSYAWSRVSASSHAPSLIRPGTAPSASTPRQPGRYGFAQPAHVIWPAAGDGSRQMSRMIGVS